MYHCHEMNHFISQDVHTELSAARHGTGVKAPQYYGLSIYFSDKN